ncbi:toll-like receptor 4 [Physella acuta]|uniref:toll-like receptor 4 n=1 Tax=Physella acuta TaxID=109671 RepID=UPI0027DE7CCE|nr:toll-like receptor 4 [Physella acuta]
MRSWQNTKYENKDITCPDNCSCLNNDEDIVCPCLRYIFNGLLNLQNLHISDYCFPNVSDDAFRGLEMLTYLRFSFDPYEKTQDQYIDANTKSLKLSKNKASPECDYIWPSTCYPDKAFGALTNLQNIHLAGTNCKPGTGFQKLKKLRSLELNHFFCLITNLKILDLSFNDFDFDINILHTARKLRILNISYNNEFQATHHLQDLIVTLRHLEELQVSAESPHLFVETDEILFETETNIEFNYTQMTKKLSRFKYNCVIKENFSFVLTTFFIHLLCLLVLAVFFHYRWKLRYLYFIGQRRLHIGGRLVNYNPQVDVFITYDEGEQRIRQILKNIILPFLREKNVSYILGEVDFPGGDMVSHISGAITGTRKTLVLLSEDLFLDHYREYEMNLAIMRELNLRVQVIVPVFVERVDLNTYPPEVETFLRNQLYRCLVYRNNQTFWTLLLHAIRNDT